MPTNLGKAQQDAISSGFLDRVGGDKFEIFVATNLLEQYGVEFAKVLAENIRKKGIVSSGALADNIFPSMSQDRKTLTIKMLDYYDFVNQGVQGVRNSRNASGSPYKFKNYGMNAEGRKSIKKYIESGKAKVSSTVNDKARGIGLEKKSLIDRKVDNLIYMIKKYGIKKTNYFTDTITSVFADFEAQMGEALGLDVKINLESLNKKKY
jgi:hypothetical protein